MRLRLLFSEAWRSLGANLSTTFAAMMTVLIGMFLLGLLIALGTWTVSWSNHVKRELVVKIDFKTNADKGGQATKAQERTRSSRTCRRTRSSARRRTAGRSSPSGRRCSRCGSPSRRSSA